MCNRLFYLVACACANVQSIYLSVTSSIMIGIEDACKNCNVVMHMLETRQNHVYVCTTIIINAHHQHQCQCGICMVVVMMKFAICI